MFARLADRLTQKSLWPYDHVVVDEAQDITVQQLRFLAAVAEGRPNSLFFAGDLGQRIFQQPFSWRALGVDIRGRARTLRINYRTDESDLHEVYETERHLLCIACTRARDFLLLTSGDVAQEYVEDLLG